MHALWEQTSCDHGFSRRAGRLRTAHADKVYATVGVSAVRRADLQRGVLLRAMRHDTAGQAGEYCPSELGRIVSYLEQAERGPLTA